MLVWDEVDILSVLEVEPEEEADGIWHKYSLCREGIQLNINVFQYDSDVQIEMLNEKTGNQVFFMRLIDCSAVKRVYEAGKEYLEFAPSKCFGSNRYDGISSIPYGVRVFAKPGIQVALFG